MQIVAITEEDMTVHGDDIECLVHSVHVQIKDLKNCAQEMIVSVSDKSWINKLNITNQKSYKARAEKTIDRLVKNVFNEVEDKVTEEFGEYLVSHCGQKVLTDGLSHVAIPIAELWNRKIVGNPGFDFHTITGSNVIAFGEAKYKSTGNPHSAALEQIVGFIKDKKDDEDLTHLQHMIEQECLDQYHNEKKAYIAAFSMKAKSPRTVLLNALKSPHVKSLLKYPELYIVGVEINV